MTYSGINKRKWERRFVDFRVGLIFPKKSIKDVQETTLRLHDISEGGAAILTAGLAQIPDFFYMQFGDDSIDRIGCYVVNRTPDMIHCQFWEELTPKYLDQLIARKEAQSAYDKPQSYEAKSVVDQLWGLVEVR